MRKKVEPGFLPYIIYKRKFLIGCRYKCNSMKLLEENVDYLPIFNRHKFLRKRTQNHENKIVNYIKINNIWFYKHHEIQKGVTE